MSISNGVGAVFLKENCSTVINRFIFRFTKRAPEA